MNFKHIRSVIDNSSSDEFTVVKLGKLTKLMAAYDHGAECQKTLSATNLILIEDYDALNTRINVLFGQVRILDHANKKLLDANTAFECAKPKPLQQPLSEAQATVAYECSCSQSLNKTPSNVAAFMRIVRELEYAHGIGEKP
jgi:hypothetical protein